MTKYSFDKAFVTSFSTKFASFLFDFILLIFINLLLCFGSNEIVKNLNPYKEANNNVNLCVNNINKLTNEAHLTSYKEDDQLKTLDEMFEEYVDSHLLLSFNLNKDDFINDDITENNVNENLKDVIPASYDNDYLGYFYIHFLKENQYQDFDFQGLSPYDFFKNVLLTNKTKSYLFDFSYDFPSLKSEHSIDIYKYLYCDSNNSRTYNDLYDLFINVLTNSTSILVNFDVYQNELINYNLNYQKLVNYTNFELIIDYTLTFILVLVIPVFIFKNGQTIGKKLNKVIVSSNKEITVKPLNLILKFIIQYIFYFFIIFFNSLIITGLQSLTFGTIPFYLFIIISFLLCLINVIVSLTHKERRSLDDILSMTYTLNARLMK